MIKQISYRIDTWRSSFATFRNFSATDPVPGKECTGREADCKGSIRVVEFQGAPSWEGWDSAPAETMVTRFYCV